jgi:hypothetical protein
VMVYDPLNKNLVLPSINNIISYLTILVYSFYIVFLLLNNPANSRINELCKYGLIVMPFDQFAIDKGRDVGCVG